MRGKIAKVGAAAAIAVVLVLSSSLVAGAGVSLPGGTTKKLYTADVSPHSVNTGATVTFTVTVTNKASSQTLGSCNLTAPGGFTLQTSPAPTQPSQGTATISGNIVQLRGLNTAMNDFRASSFSAKVPTTAGTYAWTIQCRQSNDFNPDQVSNQYTLDSAHSNLNTTASTPLPSADIAVTSNTDTPDPVVGANTVEYTIVTHNNGPATSGPLTLTDSTSAGSISSYAATNWTCSGSGSSISCTHAALASGSDAESVVVRVVAPNSDTTITNHAAVSQTGATDPAPGNNALDQQTTVTKDSSCTSGTISCGSGRIVYGLTSQVTTGSTPTATSFLVGTTTFTGVTGASGGQTWSMSAPAVPGSFCPIDFSSNVVTQCTWQMNLDPIPAIYPQGNTTFVATCYVTKCPQGVIPGAGTLVVKVADDGTHTILPQCNGSGDTNLCFTQQRIAGGHLQITVRNSVSGDPRYAGICVGGGC